MKQALLTCASVLLLCQGCSSTDQAELDKLRTENAYLKAQLATFTNSAATASAPSTSTPTPTIPITQGTGMWTVKHYVDEFGAETKNGYVSNAEPIQGTFSNSATQDSDLLVTLLIDKDLGMSIKLYEYARNNPVKAYSSDSYEVNVKDAAGKPYHLRAVNYESDRMTLDKPSAKQLHAALLKGGKVQFVIRESDTPTTVYNFTLENAGGYLNARKDLKKS
jgi:hypothetical protein